MHQPLAQFRRYAFAARAAIALVPICTGFTTAHALTPATAQPIMVNAAPDALLSIDMNRTAIVERIFATWSKQLPTDQSALFERSLSGLRADRLLAASLAGSVDTVLEILVSQDAANSALKARVTDRQKALGEVDRDLVYTPISPCRFIETRTVYPDFGIPYYGAGQFAAGEIRNYVVGSACGLPSGVTALQAQVQGQATAGFGANLEATKGGGPFGGGLTLIAANSPLFTVVSAAVPLNLGTNSIGIQVTVATAHVVMDVVGYYMPASRNGDGLRVIGGGTSTPSVVNGDNSNTTGTTTGSTISGGYNNAISANNATISGGADQVASNTASTIGGGGGNTASGSHSTVSGGFSNTSSGPWSTIGGGQDNLASGNHTTIAGGAGNRSTAISSTVGGGGYGPGSTCFDAILLTNTAPCWNEASENASTVSGGSNNRASGNSSVIAGGFQNRVASGSGAMVGGTANTITANGGNSFIGGGLRNTVTGNTSMIVGGSGGINAGFSAFMGSGGGSSNTNCYNHITAASDVNCWNEIGVNGNAASIVGGYNNRTNNFTAVIGGGASNRVEQNDSVIAGGVANTITGANAYGATIAGGFRNMVTGGGGTIAGGQSNTVSGSQSVIAGGQNNVAAIQRSSVVGGFNNFANADGAFLGGGYNNISSGLNSVVGGGGSNTASGGNSVAGGGGSNLASGNTATIGGGWANTASGAYSVVAGGGSPSLNTCFNRTTNLGDGPCQNVASNDWATVGGGIGNIVSGRQATVAGGSVNHATAERAAIGGGHVNSASGTGATVPGGRGNWASGSWSLSAGRGAATNTGGATPTHHFGTFVWSDSPDDGTPATPIATQNFRSTASNQFAVRARGGVSFKVGAPAITDPADPAYVSNAADATPGCSLPAGGAASWSCTSDRNTKEAIRAISPKAILAKVTALPLSTWQFKGTDRRHMSPMAQDFWAAFGLGVNDKAITSSDVSGVALGAIQGLSQELKQKDAKIAKLERELAAIKKKLGM